MLNDVDLEIENELDSLKTFEFVSEYEVLLACILPIARFLLDKS